MKQIIENEVDTINDLIEINNDRIEGYEKAMEELKPTDTDLQQVFTRMAAQSRGFVQELRAASPATYEDQAEGSTVKGKLYRAWQDVKSTIAGSDRYSVLAFCEFGEDAAQRAYKEALNLEEPLSSTLFDMLSRQKLELQRSHDEIKALRDAQKL
jgi:uncharacterized protein (TIGR02284 family)